MYNPNEFISYFWQKFSFFVVMKATLPLPSHHHGSLWLHKNRPPMPFAHWHDELELNVVRQGTAAYLLPTSRVNLEPNTLLWLLPEQEHILIEESRDFEMWIVVFHPKLLHQLFGEETPFVEGETAVYSRRLAQPHLQRLHTQCQELHQALPDPRRFNLGLGYLLLFAWSLYTQATQPVLCEGLHPAIASAARLLLTNAAQDTLPSLAQQVGLSPSRLSRLFKHQTGVSLQHYRNLCRLRRFLNLYETQPDRTLLDTALAAGFGSYAQFHRVFCQIMERSPRQHVTLPLYKTFRELEIGRLGD